MKFQVESLTCGRCVSSITEALRAVDPAVTLQADLTAGTIDVASTLDATDVAAVLAGIGYQAQPSTAHTDATAGECCGHCHA